jgi:hypothetical protein
VAKALPFAAAGGLVAAVIAVGIVSGGDDGIPGATSPTPSPPPVVVTSSTAPPITIAAADQVQTETTDAPIAKVPIDRPLSNGMVGDDVEMVQQRLSDLGFDLGPVDGYFGDLTRQAVWAFEKLVMGVPRQRATGQVTPEMWDRMQDPIRIEPRRPTQGLADHTEIYLPEQVMIVFHADEPVLVAHISTGELAEGATAFTPWYETADEYCETVTIDTDDRGNPLEEPVEKAICGRSYTPPGVFEAYKKVEGRRESRLGGMYDPIYINQGIAIHGALNVPLEPASHGCIRVSQYLGEGLQDLIEIGDRVLIWDGVTEPEQQSAEAMQMRFDYPDPNATTTTTSTTTTTTSTTTTIPEVDPPPSTSTSTTTTTTASSTSTTSTTTTTGPPVDDGGGGGGAGDSG